MPRTEEQFEEIRQKRRQEIMETALELFAEQGYHNTSISKIAKAAGVSKGLLYNYFESKEALLDAIIFGAADEKKEVTDKVFVVDIPPKEQLKMIIEGFFAMTKQNIHHWKLLTILTLQEGISEQMKLKVEQQKATGMAQFKHLFEALNVENPELETFMFGGVLTGVLMQYIHLGNEYPLDEMKDYIIKRFCK